MKIMMFLRDISQSIRADDMIDDSEAVGLDGIFFPSQAYAGRANLVIYRSSARSSEQLRVHDLAWASQRLPRI
ncbi:TPA: hypothetical protein L6B03_20890 [Pseudomonas aeruginosa]|nr:hypothetical protein [Pseudomonas aeruginosa]